MASTTIPRLGTIDWVDLNAPDIDAACSFYSTVLGWAYQTTETPMGTYHVALVGGHDAAGLMAPPPGSPPVAAWTVFVRVGSIEQTLAAVGNAGGSVLAEPFEIPGGARVAVVADPAGATIALIAGGPEPGPDEPPLRRPDSGAVAWCELLCRDPHAAVGFYDAVFGWQAVLDPASGYTTFRLGDLDIGGLLPMPDEVPAEAPSHWMVYFHVANVQAASEASVAAGGSVLRPVAQAGGMTFAVLADCLGATFGVLTPSAAAQPQGS